jgi:hypothetical protein
LTLGGIGSALGVKFVEGELAVLANADSAEISLLAVLVGLYGSTGVEPRESCVGGHGCVSMDTGVPTGRALPSAAAPRGEIYKPPAAERRGVQSIPVLATGAIGGLVVGYPVSETTVYPLRQIDCVTASQDV